MCHRLGHNKWVRLFALTLCAALLAAPLPADADDWSVKRSAFDPRAVARFDRMLAARPTDGYAFRQLTRLYSKHRSLAALTRKWEARARAAPRSAGPRIVLGRLMMLSRSWPRAAAHFAAAAELQPGRDWAMAGLASALEKQGKLTEAAAAYKVALTRTRKTSRKKRYLAALAHLSASAGDHAAAAEHHRALATLEPRSRAHKLALARALSRAGKNAEALATLEPLLASTRDSTRRVELLKELGRLQGAMGNLDAAVAHYRKAMSLTARGHWLRRELTDAIIDIHRKQEKLPDLIKDLERRWKRRGAFEDEVLGKLYDETGDEERALAAYRAAVRRAPHLVQLRLRIIALLERSGRSEEVLLEYRTLARMAPGEPRHEIELARRLHAAGKQKEAVSRLDRCGRRFPSDASVQSALADMFARWGEQKRALLCSKRLVRIEPREPGHIINLGEQYYLDGKKALAHKTWARLLRVVPGKAAALAKLAEVYAQHNLHDKAIKLYRKAAKMAPKVAAYQRGMALLWESKRQTSKAVAAWQKVRALGRAQGGIAGRRAEREARAHIIKVTHRTYQLRRLVRKLGFKLNRGNLDPSDQLLLAEGLERLESWEQAARVYLMVLERTPSSVDVLLALERVYRRQRKLDLALDTLKKLAQVQPSGAREYYQRMADLLLQLYRDKEALEYAHKAVEAGSRDAPSLERLGRLLENKEDYAAAAAAYRKAIAMNPDHVQAHFALARLHSRGGEPARADAAYRQIIKRASDPEQVRRAFRLGVTTASYAGTLEQLERVLLPRTQRGANREVYRELLVRVYRRTLPPLVQRARRGDARTRRQARQALIKIGRRGLAPLLEELAATNWSSQDLVQLLGYMGNPNAVAPLLRIALKEPEQVFIIRGRAPRSLRRILWNTRSSSLRSWSSSARQANLRVAAAAAAGRLASPRAVEGLGRLLGSREGPMRDVAAWALARTATPAAARALFASLGDRRVAVQAAACVGLGAGGDRQLRPVLEEVMQDSARSSTVRAACAWGLGALGDPAALDRLEQTMRAGDGDLQRAAAWAMGAIGDRAAIDPLLRALWLQKGPRVRRAMLWSLRRLAATSSSPASRPAVPDMLLHDGRVDLAEFMRRLTEQADAPRRGAMDAQDLALIKGHGEAITAGISLALSRHRDAVLRVLGELDGHHAHLTLGPLTAGAQDLAPASRARLARVTAAALAPLARPLARLCAHREPAVRARALRLLARLSPTDAAGGTLLRDAISGGPWQVAVAALDALKRCHQAGAVTSSRATREARAALSSPAWRLRERAVGLLAALAAQTPSQATVRLLARTASRDRDGFVRQAAVRGLAGVRDEAARRALQGALQDEAPAVRAEACRALASSAGPGATSGRDGPRRAPAPATPGACQEASKSRQ